MKPFLSKTMALVCCCFFLLANSPAQVISPAMTVDGVLLSASPTQEQEPIYRGAEYWRYRNKIENEIPYYKSDTITTGNVVYFNRSYKNVPLLYDQISDELITIDLTGRIMIRLFTPEIESFQIHDVNFIHYKDPNIEKQGFWEVLVDSKTKLLKREFKVIAERVINSDIGYVNRPHLYYRIILNGKFYDIQDKKLIPEIFADKKEQMKAFLKSNRRKLRKAGFEGTLKATTTYYNDITAAR